MKNNIVAVVLAAGRGERMKSDIPKVLHTLCYRPMLDFVLDLTRDLKIKRTLVVLGHKHQKIKGMLKKGMKIVIQRKLLGTGDAVRKALAVLKSFKGTVLVLYADNPLLKKETIAKLIEHHRKSQAAATLLVAKVDKPKGYGRILRDKYSGICGIVEEKDADDFQKESKEINTGIVCFDKEKLVSALRQVRPNNQKKEYYLTDCISILYKKNALIESVRLEDIQEALGINSRSELVKANKIMQSRLSEKFMQEGVTLVDPDSIFIGYGAKIGKDSVIYPFTVIEKDVKIGKHCLIGPFAHLREGTVIEDEVVAGNFLEIARSKLSRKTIAKHFGYIGDSRIGRQVNIGAGTVTANFDGRRKNLTVIKDKAFIGSDTVLVAPVKIGKSAKTGAGSVVTSNKDVADGQVVAGVPAKPLVKSGRKKR